MKVNIMKFPGTTDLKVKVIANKENHYFVELRIPAATPNLERKYHDISSTFLSIKLFADLLVKNSDLNQDFLVQASKKILSDLDSISNEVALLKKVYQEIKGFQATIDEQ